MCRVGFFFGVAKIYKGESQLTRELIYLTGFIGNNQTHPDRLQRQMDDAPSISVFQLHVRVSRGFRLFYSSRLLATYTPLVFYIILFYIMPFSNILISKDPDTLSSSIEPFLIK